MEYDDLRVLEAVARNGSMNRAAAELHMVQSNVTARIRSLELQVGTELFERSNRGVSLTAAGQRLLPYANRLGALLREAQQAARDDGTPNGTLRIGALETTVALRLPPILSAYARIHPAVRLVLTTGTSADLVADLLDHRLDATFVAGPISHPDLTEEPLFREELMLVTAPAVRSLEGLNAMPDLKTIVFRQGCSYRQRLDNLLLRRGIQARQPFEFGSLEAIIGCVAAGIGITLLPRSVVAAAWREGRVWAHELPQDEARVDTMFVRRTNTYYAASLMAFLDVARPSPAPGCAD